LELKGIGNPRRREEQKGEEEGKGGQDMGRNERAAGDRSEAGEGGEEKRRSRFFLSIVVQVSQA